MGGFAVHSRSHALPNAAVSPIPSILQTVTISQELSPQSLGICPRSFTYTYVRTSKIVVSCRRLHIDRVLAFTSSFVIAQTAIAPDGSHNFRRRPAPPAKLSCRYQHIDRTHPVRGWKADRVDNDLIRYVVLRHEDVLAFLPFILPYVHILTSPCLSHQ
jgi:hypothetical protein